MTWRWLTSLGLLVSHVMVMGATYYYVLSATKPRKRCINCSLANAAGGGTKRDVVVVPLPLKWIRFDPTTDEGQRQIADQIINRETNNEIADYLFRLTSATQHPLKPYTREMFDRELQTPLTSTTTTGDGIAPESTILWTQVIPFVWSLFAADQKH